MVICTVFFFVYTVFTPYTFFIIFRAVVLLTADYWINNKILSPTVLLNWTWKMMVKFQSSNAISSFDKIRICIVFRRRMTLSNICDRALCKNVCKNGQKKMVLAQKKALKVRYKVSKVSEVSKQTILWQIFYRVLNTSLSFISVLSSILQWMLQNIEKYWRIAKI